MTIPYITIAKNDATAAVMRQVILQTGGVALSSCANDLVFADWKAVLPAACHTQPVLRNSKFIFVLEEVLELLSTDELASVLAHEEGHRILGHLDSTAAAGVLLNMEFEYAADDYSVAQTSALLLHTALTKMRDFAVAVLIPALFGDDDLPQYLVDTFAKQIDDALSPRFSRLLSYIN